ncbi:hypothetical protein AB4Y36_16350 [Paraburkholderia sp. BR10936]|uniref:hypothetical protein n=1 Tax=Paraburkholderia sp. BR10936 TaxID=3236993 RepID=UPI0034D17741
MTISNLAVPVERIKPIGGRSSTATAGHQFDLTFRAEVKAPMLGKLMADDIECPNWSGTSASNGSGSTP